MARKRAEAESRLLAAGCVGLFLDFMGLIRFSRLHSPVGMACPPMLRLLLARSHALPLADEFLRVMVMGGFYLTKLAKESTTESTKSTEKPLLKSLCSPCALW
jgi:hypothetical protein